MAEECPAHCGVFDELAADPVMNGVKHRGIDLGPGFTQHGNCQKLLQRAGIDAESVRNAALELLGEGKADEE